MLMAFSHFLNGVIITYGNTESRFPSAQHKYVASCFLTVAFSTSPVFRTVFSPEVKVVFYFFTGCVKEYLINPLLALYWRLKKTTISIELWD